jgi:hypothetical protein
MPFEQYATGVMSIEVEGDFHCGPDKQSPKDFTWEVLVRYPDGVLDEHGFLLDNLVFEEFFNGLGRTELSCERLMEECCKKLWEMSGGRAEELRTTIWAIPGKVKVTKVMRRGEERG